MLSIIYDAAANAFIQVGTFVAITLLLFGYMNYKSGGKIIEHIHKHKKFQVIYGSLLGLTPGCGGAILVMPLFLKGQVTFGTVVATLIATMGDAAFVLIASAMPTFLTISIISFVTAIIFGYFIDWLKIGTTLNKPSFSDELLTQNKIFQPEPQFEEASCCCTNNTNSKNQFIYQRKKWIYIFRHHVAYIIFWILALSALPLGIMNLMQIDINNALPIKNLGLIGVIGTFFSLLYNIFTHKFLADDTLPEIKSKQNSLKETLIHNAEETAFVIMWVFLALFVYELIVMISGGEDVILSLLKKTGYAAVLVGLLVGFIPGCGPHIILATLYVHGAFPFSGLIANAICNDGDALFPLIAMDKKASLLSSLYSFIPAFIVGTIFYFLGF